MSLVVPGSKLLVHLLLRLRLLPQGGVNDRGNIYRYPFLAASLDATIGSAQSTALRFGQSDSATSILARPIVVSGSFVVWTTEDTIHRGV